MAQSSTIATAVRQAAAFDRGAVSLSAGVLAAIPVATVVAICIAIGQPVAAVTTGVGSMLVGIAWRATGGRPPLGVLAADTLAMALATLTGCVTGRVLWLHLVVLIVWSFFGGLLVALGRRPGVVGFQAILAAVAFGRFAQPIGPAAGLAGLVAAGGATQVAFLALVRWPTPLDAQRRACAAALRELAELADGPPRTTSAAPAGTALDEAAASLSSWSLLGAPAVWVLRNLVTDGYRLRVGLTALDGLAATLDPIGEPARAVQAIALDAGRALRSAARTLEHRARDLDDLGRSVDRLSGAVAELQRGPTPDGVSPALWTALTRRLAALGGQLRALAGLAPAAAIGGGLRNRRPRPRTHRPFARMRSDLHGLLANISRDSPATRHALRLAVAVPLVTLLARELPVHRGYWVVIAAAAVLRPEFGATFTRGVERAGGTALGVTIAGLITAGVHPSGGVTVAIVGVLAFGAFATFQASYAVGFAFVTALVVFLINTNFPDTPGTAAARLVDTLIGGTLGLLLFAAWPTWARASAQDALAELVVALRDYAAAVLAAIAAGTSPPTESRALARAARLARTRAEADVMRSLGEPPRRRIDPRIGPGVLSEMRRVVQAIHELRLDADEDVGRMPIPAVSPLSRAVGLQLAAIARALQTDELALSSEQIDLRDALHRCLEALPDSAPPTLAPVLDELVDAIDATAELVTPAAEAAPVAA